MLYSCYKNACFDSMSLIMTSHLCNRSEGSVMPRSLLMLLPSPSIAF
jgi:hypothetical protein